MSLTVEVFYSFQSPYSYLALETMYDYGARYDLEILWQPFSAKAAGQQPPAGTVTTDRLSYILEDTKRFAESHGVPLVYPEGWPEEEFDPTRITRGALVAQDLGVLFEYNCKVFHRCWGLGQDPNEEDFLNQLADDLDVDLGEFLSKLSSSDTRERVKGVYRRGRKLGVFDTPTVVIDGERYFGLDKILLLDELFKKRAG